MNLFAKYFEEVEGCGTVLLEDGFAVYRMEPDHIYLRDIYIVPEKRHTGIGHELLEMVSNIGRVKGYKKLVGSVVPSNIGANKRVQGMLKSGFQIMEAQENIIFFFKEI